MSTAYLHVNGITYRLAQKLETSFDQALHGLRAKVDMLAGGGGPGVVTFTVLLQEQEVALDVVVDQVATVAFWTQDAAVDEDPRETADRWLGAELSAG